MVRAVRSQDHLPASDLSGWSVDILFCANVGFSLDTCFLPQIKTLPFRLTGKLCLDVSECEWLFVST